MSDDFATVASEILNSLLAQQVKRQLHVSIKDFAVEKVFDKQTNKQANKQSDQKFRID